MASKVGKRTRKISVKTCVVCCEDEPFYAIGFCDHWVCFKCCVRMRVLGEENYCSVCRTDLSQVFLTRKRVPYDELFSKRSSFSYFDKKHGIHYEDRAIEKAVRELLQHPCPVCPDHPPEKTFNQLRTHVRRAHEMSYCDLCVKHLRKFTNELKVYNRADLARHRRQGDADDSAYKGHPLCEFCDERFLDNDELHRHLRRLHFWCHFCEREGGQQYYPDYKHLRKHFRQAHFLCEEGDCLHEQYTSVFSTKVDFQAHVAVKHAKKLSKAEARQARQLDVDLQLPPRGRVGPSRRNQGPREGADHWPKEQQAKEREKRGKFRSGGEAMQDSSAITLSDPPYPPPSADTQPYGHSMQEDFPPMVAFPETTVQSSKREQEYGKPKTREFANSKINSEDFPGLPGASSSGKQFAKCLDNSKVTSEDFPSLGTAPPNGKNFAKRLDGSMMNSEDFPSLPGAPAKTKAAYRPPPGFSNVSGRPPGSDVKKSKNTGREKPPGFSSNGEPPGLIKKNDDCKENVDSHTPGQNQEAATTQASQGRNQALVENIKALLGYNDAKFAEFKRVSGGFRQGSITARHYYDECFQLIGSKFSQVFFELVDLLPDATKQKELLCAHQDAKVVAKQDCKAKNSTNNTSKDVPGVWNSAGQSGTSRPQQPAVQTSTMPGKSNRLHFSSEQDFPSLPPASGKRFVQPLYRGNKQSAAMLKEAWVRGK